MKTALAALMLAAVTAPQMASAQPLRIFLFTSDVRDGKVDEQLKARQEALRDLSRALSAAKYRKTFTVVTSRDRADVLVELLSRGETTRSSSRSSSRAIGGGTASASQSASETKHHLKVRLSAGDLAQELITEGDLPWAKLAEKAAADIAGWAAKNELRIRKGRADDAQLRSRRNFSGSDG
jgi:hypothetical protein